MPLFIGFVEAGIPLGVTFSFLIAAPMVNEIALVLLYGLFGWEVAALYLVTGLLIAIVAGWVIGRLKMERYIEDWVREIRMGEADAASEELAWPARMSYAWQAVKDIVGKVWPYVLAGIAVGALIHGYVPENFMAGIMGADAWWSVPLAVLLGIPMYSNAAGIIPIVAGAAREGRRAGHGAGLHDGGHRALAAGDDHPQEGAQVAAHRRLPRRGRRRHHVRRLPLQRGPLSRGQRARWTR